ncbi:helix-hairpin-helix domain-containing protein [Candidatus Dojkabacteria bacterium]|nr:helix-hairpin-helix domain-containing protein [Candidatus Dojkabacteria bacterium]
MAILAAAIGCLVLIKLQNLGVSRDVVIDTRKEDPESQKAEETVKTISVDISGEVNNPGVYKFQEGQTVEDAINTAGGFTENADSDYINKDLNRAQKLVDEQKIFIPAKGELNTSPIEGSFISQSKSGKININTASLEELDSLPGIGPSYAQRIIDGRPYSNIEELKNIKGIGEATFSKIKDLITV